MQPAWLQEPWRGTKAMGETSSQWAGLRWHTGAAPQDGVEHVEDRSEEGQGGAWGTGDRDRAGPF